MNKSDLLNLIYSYERIKIEACSKLYVNGYLDVSYKRVMTECDSAMVDLYKRLLYA